MPRRTSRLSLLFLAVVAAQLVGCGSGPQKNGLSLPAVAVVPRVVSGVFLDAATQLPIAGSLDVTVRDRAGALAAAALDQAGKPLSHFTVQDGVVTFRVSPAVSLPQTFIVIGNVAGYDGGSAVVQVDSDVGTQFTVSLVRVAAPPAGVSAVSAPIGAATATGVLTAGATLTTPVEPHTGGEVQVAIPPGTALTTSAGVPLTGAVQAQVTYFDNSDASSLAAYPGGFGSAPAPAGSLFSGVFVSGGFGALQITDAAGNVASRFSAPVTVNVSVPFATVNPVTHRPVQAGDVVPFWTYDQATGAWTSAGTVTLGPGTFGTNFVATAQITQGTYFNVDWDVAGCLVTPTITLVGALLQPLTVRVQAVGGGYLSSEDVYVGSSTIAVPDAPGNVPVNVTAWFDGQQVGAMTIPDLCSGPFGLVVKLPQFQLSSLEVNAFEVCVENASLKAPLPSATVVVSPAAGGAPIVQVTDGAGAARVSQLLAGRSYTVSVTGLIASSGAESTVVKPFTAVASGGTLEVDVPVSCTATTVTGSGGAGF